MSLLNKPFAQMAFEDVEDYCKEQHLETATLDHKKAMRTRTPTPAHR
jgi:hypothetical protein